MWTPSYTVELHWTRHRHRRSDRNQRTVPGLHTSPIGKLLVKNLGLPTPASWSGTPPARRSSTAPSRRRARPARRVAAGHARHARRRLGASGHDARRDVQGTGLRRHRPHVVRRSWSRCRDFFTPLLRSLDRCPRLVVLGTPPEQVERRRARRPARARGLHPQPRQGDRPRRHRPARVRRRGRRGRGRLDAGLPALPQVGVRLRPGRPHRRHRHHRGRRGRRLDPPAGGQGRARHRRQPRHRRADRPGAAPRRRHRGRRRRAAGRQRPAGPDEGARRRPPGPRHHRARTRRSGSRTTSRRSTAAWTSSCTTPASPATRSWRTWPRTAGTR